MPQTSFFSMQGKTVLLLRSPPPRPFRNLCQQVSVKPSSPFTPPFSNNSPQDQDRIPGPCPFFFLLPLKVAPKSIKALGKVQSDQRLCLIQRTRFSFHQKEIRSFLPPRIYGALTPHFPDGTKQPGSFNL